MRPGSIVQFERVLWAALAIDLVNNFLALPRMKATLVAQGLTPGPLVLTVACLLSPVIGLLLWYFIARRASVVARWIMVVLVGLGALSFAYVLRRPIAADGRAMVAGAVLTELLKVFAMTRLFTADAKRWFARENAA